MEQLLVTVFVAGLPEESTSWAVKLKVPGVVGVPVMAPVEEFRDCILDTRVDFLYTAHRWFTWLTSSGA